MRILSDDPLTPLRASCRPMHGCWRHGGDELPLADALDDEDELAQYTPRMSSEIPDVVVVGEPIDPMQLRALVERFFGDMVKLVIDVRRRLVAVGGELHADAEAVLLEAGSKQADLWGANYYPGLGEDDCLQFTALINIRPGQDNRAMEVQDPQIRDTMRDIVHEVVGRGGPL